MHTRNILTENTKPRVTTYLGRNAATNRIPATTDRQPDPIDTAKPRIRSAIRRKGKTNQSAAKKNQYFGARKTVAGANRQCPEGKQPVIRANHTQPEQQPRATGTTYLSRKPTTGKIQRLVDGQNTQTHRQNRTSHQLRQPLPQRLSRFGARKGQHRQGISVFAQALQANPLD